MDRRQILFVDAREAGTLVHRTERILTGADLTRIAGPYHAWRGTLSTGVERAAYRDEPGFCASVGLEAVRHHGHDLTPSRHVFHAPVGSTAQDDRRGALVDLTAPIPGRDVHPCRRPAAHRLRRKRGSQTAKAPLPPGF
ncbi:N-6 DNA methylase [Streptomyces longwoodensis]|uniref:N-6 DNA methylase n=1 Tax=Streptomyces longwoodensis TaxID=68231 RepID=UPI0030E2A6F3